MTLIITVKFCCKTHRFFMRDHVMFVLAVLSLLDTFIEVTCIHHFKFLPDSAFG